MADVRGFGALALVLALVALAAWALLAPLVVPAPAPDVDLGSLNWTQHARTAHAGQEYNAETIHQTILDGACSPILAFACGETIIVMCPVGEGGPLWMGLVIGLTTPEEGPQIVTGFAAREGYWKDAVKGCSPMELR